MTPTKLPEERSDGVVARFADHVCIHSLVALLQEQRIDGAAIGFTDHAYVHALSALLSQRRTDFELRVLESWNVSPEQIDDMRTEWSDVLTDAWMKYAGRKEFAEQLRTCRKRARAAAILVQGRALLQPVSDVKFTIDDNPFHKSYYPTIQRAYGGATYKPARPDFCYDYDQDMEAYMRLGSRLARTRRDVVPSTWIRSHANDTVE